MVARVEPPRPRNPAPARYPGLTPEERGALPTDPSVALWVAPSDIPASERPAGFLAPPDGSLLPTEAPPAEEPEGLFDVPGLLERLWLARALEGQHERSWASIAARLPPRAPVPPPAVGVAFTSHPSAEPLRAPPAPPMVRSRPAAAPPAASSPAEPPAPTRPAATALWSSWICPQCYLTNDRAVDACRGCHRPAPRL